MRSFSRLMLVLLFSATIVPPAGGSSLPDSSVRIRVTARTPERERWIGSLVSIVRDTLTMRNDVSGRSAGLRRIERRGGALVTVPTLHVTSYEISRGSHRNGFRGAGVGLAAGVILGAGIGYGSYNGHDFLVSSAGESAAFGALTLGIVGLALGTVIGTLTHSERWREVPLEGLRGGTPR